MTTTSKSETGNLNQDLFQWGHKQSTGSGPQESGGGDPTAESSLELRIIEMKSILRDKRVIHAD